MALRSEVMDADTNSRSQSGKATAFGAIGDSMTSREPLSPIQYVFYP